MPRTIAETFTPGGTLVKHTIDFAAGEDFKLRLTATVNGSIAGQTREFSLADTALDEPLFLATNADITVVDAGSAGTPAIIDIDFASVDTFDWATGIYYGQLRRNDSGNNTVERVFSAQVQENPLANGDPEPVELPILWADIANTPTTVAGYGITDAVAESLTLTINGTAYDLSANRSWTISAGVWGSITGTLSAQTDLQAALDAKAATSHTHIASNITDFDTAVRTSRLDQMAAPNVTVSFDAGVSMVSDSSNKFTLQNVDDSANVVLLTKDSGGTTSATVTGAGVFTGTSFVGPLTGTASGNQPLDATLTALAGQNWSANAIPVGSGADTVAQVSFAANTFPARSSSGNLVAKTITDAALTVLDDTTVSAMVDTLGGAAAEGTGAIVRKTSPTIVTPTIASILGVGSLAAPAGGGAIYGATSTDSEFILYGRDTSGNVWVPAITITAGEGVVGLSLHETASIAGDGIATVGYVSTNYQPKDAALTALASGSDFVIFSGPTTSNKTFTLPDASSTILTSNASVTVAQGGTGRATGTTAYSLVATGTTATGAQQTLASGATTEILVGGGAAALPVWTTAQGSGAPVRATSPTITTPSIAKLANLTSNGVVKTSSGDGTLSVDTGTYYTSGGTDVVVADGGTGLSSATAYAVLCGGTTSTGAFQSIASVGTATHVLTSNGAGALPTFQAASGGVSDGDKGDITVSSSGATWTIDAATVTLAKMANLTQDSFIIRTTASTGVPETATCTSAARTVLDDTTVANMVTTLGGAAATGTAGTGLVYKTSPAFTTPDLGVASAGNVSACIGGKLVQRVAATSTSTFSTSTQIPTDNTIPQNGEGAELITCAITPKSTGNKLVIRVSSYIMASTAANISGALFIDTTADAVWAGLIAGDNTGAFGQPIAVMVELTPPSTSAQTYKFRYGPNTSATVYVNRNASGSLFGGVGQVFMEILEVAP